MGRFFSTFPLIILLKLKLNIIIAILAIVLYRNEYCCQDEDVISLKNKSLIVVPQKYREKILLSRFLRSATRNGQKIHRKFFKNASKSIEDHNKIDYCNPSLCDPDKKHIGCRNNGKIHSSCASISEIVHLGSIQDLITSRHNDLRNKIAGGEISKFEPAAKMSTMTWDSELAFLAELNLKTCRFEHDECRNTRSFKYVGQNLASWEERKIDSDLGENILEYGIGTWFDEYKDANMNDMKQLSDVLSDTIGHFSMIISDRNYKVGCGLLKTVKSNKKRKCILACNYATTNIVGWPVYERGPPTSGCKTGRNHKYQFLCSLNEKYNVNDFNLLYD